MTIHQFPRTGHVDLMQLTLSVLERSVPTADEIAETLRGKGYFDIDESSVVQAIDALRRNGYLIYDIDDADGLRYQLVMGGSAA